MVSSSDASKMLFSKRVRGRVHVSESESESEQVKRVSPVRPQEPVLIILRLIMASFPLSASQLTEIISQIPPDKLAEFLYLCGVLATGKVLMNQQMQSSINVFLLKCSKGCWITRV